MPDKTTMFPSVVLEPSYQMKRANLALKAYEVQQGDPDNLRDLLADLMYWAVERDIDFDEELRIARDNYFDELSTTKAVNEERRREAADAAFANYDLGDLTVAGTDGWETTHGKDGSENEWTRKFYIENDNEEEDSYIKDFIVQFKPNTAEVEEAHVYGWF